MVGFVIAILLHLLFLPLSQLKAVNVTVEVVVCQTEKNALDVAEAISGIDIPSDGVVAYRIYLNRKYDCMFADYTATNEEVSYEGASVVSENIFVLPTFGEVDAPDEYPQFIILAPKRLMREFKACRKFFEKYKTLEGCEIET